MIFGQKNKRLAGALKAPPMGVIRATQNFAKRGILKARVRC